MHRISATIRITIGLALLSTSALLLARTIGVGPDETFAKLEGRRKLCEALAVNGSMLVSRNDTKALETSLAAITDRYPEVLSVGLRHDNQLLFQVGDHESHSSSASQVVVPLIAEGTRWGNLEVRFQPLGGPGLLGILSNSFVQLLLFLTVGNAVVFFLYLKKTLQHLDPSRVVPNRVRNAFDTMPGGLVILDNHERIVLANKAFATAVEKPTVELQGLSLSRFSWLDESEQSVYPWRDAFKTGVASSGVTMKLCEVRDKPRYYIVNSSPIHSEEGHKRGVLVSFEDVTELEKNKTELKRTMEVLRVSRDEIRKQNEELQRLATQDPLTGCINRRSFYEILEVQWSSVQRYHHQLSCVMLDVDHFKLVNDEHGHSMGDLVLKKVAATLRKTLRPTDSVCRYGGEEFCILLPHTGTDAAEQAAERCRKAVEELVLPGLSVTASLGVSSVELGAAGPQEMIEQADQSLYMAKRNGRNQVVRWDQQPAGLEIDLADGDASQRAVTGDSHDSADQFDLEIPFHAVSALISALAYRDVRTAEHSRRVADLCVIAADGILSARECYILETAGLLHDIGKIGVPDSILLKPGPLTQEEWKMMGIHDRVGVEIIASAFSCAPLTEIIRNHHAWYEGNPREPGLPTGEDIPLGARILTLADAYDAIVSDRVYRKGRSQEEAFAELRRCAPRQFDPQLVERFIAAVQARYETRGSAKGRMSRQGAVRFGLQIERLADALDNQDIKGLALLAGRLNRTAEQYGEDKLALAAVELESAAHADAEMAEIVNLTNDLMSLCRATQSAFLGQCLDSDQEEQEGEEAGAEFGQLTAAGS